MNYAALKTLIASTAECAGKSAEEIVEILNRPRAGDIRIAIADLPRSSLTRFLASRGLLSKIYDAARNTGLPHTIRSICLAVEFVCVGGSDSIDMSDTSVGTMIGALVSASIISTADQTALVEWATRAGSLAEQAAGDIGSTVVTLDDVRRAN